MTGTALKSTLRLLALIGLFASSLAATALDLDRTFGVYGYVPVSAPETQSDTAAAIIKQTDGKLVVLGTRRVNGRGTLLLQRYASDGSLDPFFGQFGTAAIDMAGASLTAKQLVLHSDGRFFIVAETASDLRIYFVLPTGALDTSFGTGGELQIPFAGGTLPGTSSVHLQEARFLVISRNPPGATSSLTVSSYLLDGTVDDDFGFHGREVINLGAGIEYAGQATVLIDGRIVVVLAGSNGATRGLLMLDEHGRLDTSVNGGNPVFPAALQGKTVTKLVPLFSGLFVAIGVSGAGGAQATTVTRFTPQLQVDPVFGTGGTLTVQSPDAGGSIAMTEAYETLDNMLVLTGSSNNGLIVARYSGRGQPDPTFNPDKGVLVLAEPGARATVGVASLEYAQGQIIHLAHAVLFGAGTGGAAPSRAFLVRSVDGVPDVNYASQGIVNLFGVQAPTAEHAQQVLTLPDGRLLVLSQTGVGDGLVAFLSRYLTDGRLDPTFGSGGRKMFIQNGRCEWPMSMRLQPDGKVVLLGTSFNMIDCGTSAMFGKRFDVNGVEENFPLFYSGVLQRGRSGDLALQADNKIVVTGQDDRSLVVARFQANGFADQGFGTGGRVLWPANNVNSEARGGAVLVRADQKILVAGTLDGAQIVLLQLNPDGTFDSSFGIGGVAAAPVAPSFLEVQAMQLTPAGKVLVLARSGQRALLAQFAANGAVDQGFGVNGQLLLPLFIGGGGQYTKFGMAIQADGGIVVSGQTPISPASEVQLIRLTANGQNDTTFGPNGAWRWRPSVFYAAGATGVASAPNGSLYVIGYGIPGSFLARLGTGVATAQVVEFYNTLLNHYFITADPAEQSGIDGGSAGPGWSRTGMSFQAYTTALGVPPGQSPVCRFYGSTAIDPATGQRRGPNSHFYTVEAAECAQVQLDPGWTFEGIAFYTRGRDIDGLCPVGLVAVLRVYNDRARFNDSNHRYIVDFATYQLMIGLGWIGEGVVFCTPP